MMVRAIFFIALTGIALVVGFWISKARQPPASIAARPFSDRQSGESYQPPPDTMWPAGDPEEAVKDFRRIYAAADGFRKVHGRLPTILEFKDFSQPIGGVQLTPDDFINPDWENSRSGHYPNQGRWCHYPLRAFFPPSRLGYKFAAFPKEGRRDVCATSGFNAFERTVKNPDGTRDRFYHGFYVVLYSDGEIWKVKQAEVLHYQNPEFGAGCSTGFPGQSEIIKFHRLQDCPSDKRHKFRRVIFVD